MTWCSSSNVIVLVDFSLGGYMDQSNTLATYRLGWGTHLKSKTIKIFVWSLMSLFICYLVEKL